MHVRSWIGLRGFSWRHKAEQPKSPPLTHPLKTTHTTHTFTTTCRIAFLLLRRLSLHQKFPDTFDIVKHVADKIILTMWKRAERDSDPITWMRSRRDLLGLIMPKAQVQAVIDLGDDWETAAEEHMIACIEAGSATASRLFASCIAAQLEKKVETEMLAGVAKLLKLRPPHGVCIERSHVDTIRGEVLTKCDAIAGFRCEVRLCVCRCGGEVCVWCCSGCGVGCCLGCKGGVGMGVGLCSPTLSLPLQASIC